MRKRVLIVHGPTGSSPSVKGLRDSRSFDARSIEGLACLMPSVVDYKPALVLFDMDAWTELVEEALCKLSDLRVSRHIRKVVIASNGSLDEKIDALDAGADDFLPTSISSRELAARIEAVLRSYVGPAEEEDLVQIVGDLHLHREAMEVSLGHDRIRLTPIECHLLQYFMDQAGHVLSRDELMENIWFPRSETEDRRVVDVYICRLREKIEETPSHPQRLLTRRGGGYVLIDPDLRSTAPRVAASQPLGFE